jgi:peroxiredoxin
MREKIFFYYLFLIFIFLLNLPFTVEGGEEDLFPKMRITPIKGDRKPLDFSLKDLDGRKVGLRQFREKFVLLNFWATWCGPCKEEMPGLEVLYQKFKDKKFILIAISVDYEGLQPVQEFISKHHYTFPVLLDPKCEILDLFEVKGIPTTFLIDKKGKMVGKAIGPRDWKSPDVVSLVNLLIEK